MIKLNNENYQYFNEGDPGHGMTIKDSIVSSIDCASINPFENFKVNEKPQGYYIGIDSNKPITFEKYSHK